MLMIPPTVRIFVATGATDLRRGYDGLSALVRDTLGGDPASGDLYAFRNRRGDMLKILFASRQGLCLFAKRLEKGVFHWPEGPEGPMQIEAGHLAVLLEGLELAEKRRAKSAVRPNVALR